MIRHTPTLLLLTLIVLAPTVQAAELGRLFFTPQQRQQMDYQGTMDNGESKVHRNYIIVNGVVQKKGGKRTVWINGTAQEDGKGNDQTPGTVPVTVPGKSNPVKLKVGQKLILDTPAPEEEQ